MSGQRTLVQLDRALDETGCVDRELFSEFEVTYGYNAATPMSWLLGRLKVLAHRLAAGRSLSLHEPSSGAQRTVESMEQFKAWMDRHFPGTWS